MKFFRKATTKKRAYADIGPSMGTCSVCGREVYAVPGLVTVQLVTSNQTDKVEATAVWCRKCGTLYCMGCGVKSDRRCFKCKGELVDHYNR